jgi:hypothetical protein
MLKCGMCSTCVDRAIPCVPRVRRKRGPPNDRERQQRARLAALDHLPPCAPGPKPCFPPSHLGTSACASMMPIPPGATASGIVKPPLPGGGLCGIPIVAAPAPAAQSPMPNLAEPLAQAPTGLGMHPLDLQMQLSQMGASLFGNPLLSACMANPVFAGAYMQNPFLPASAALWAAAAGAGYRPPTPAGPPVHPFGLAVPLDPSAAMGAQPPFSATSTGAGSAPPNLAHPASMPGVTYPPAPALGRQWLPRQPQQQGVLAPVAPWFGGRP